jgi:deazaflavin-dependent oxidoreductase (nitroreductase family)
MAIALRCTTMASKSFERLRRVGDRQTLRLTHYGRKSGRPYEVTIWYLVDGDQLYLVSANADRNWVRNVKARPAISLRIGDEVFNGNVRALTDAQEREKVNRLVERKYWYVAPMIRLGQFLISMGIIRDNTAAFEVILAGE